MTCTDELFEFRTQFNICRDKSPEMDTMIIDHLALPSNQEQVCIPEEFCCVYTIWKSFAFPPSWNLAAWKCWIFVFLKPKPTLHAILIVYYSLLCIEWGLAQLGDPKSREFPPFSEWQIEESKSLPPNRLFSWRQRIKTWTGIYKSCISEKWHGYKEETGSLLCNSSRSAIFWC